jgi:aspartate racemase
MEHAFYRNRLIEQHGLEVIIPSAEDRDTIHRIIHEELCFGLVLPDPEPDPEPESRSEYRRIVGNIESRGLEANILGYREISLLVSQRDSTVPLFNTAAIRARAEAEEALGMRS